MLSHPKTDSLRDWTLILLLLSLGLLGQFILFDPLRILAPDLPMLSPHDWPGSQLTTPRLIMAGWQWRSQRSFLQSIDQPPGAGVTQVIAWYADQSQAAAAWEQHKSEPYYDYPILATSTESNRPQSILFCTPVEPMTSRECSYRAYWGNWYTYVDFYARTTEEFPPEEMQILMQRVDQLLMSAPDKPCQGFFCRDTRPSEHAAQ